MSLMGEEDSLLSVKRIRNKYTGVLATYGFLSFESDASALMAMHKLNGKIIPNSTPPVRFQLSHASAKGKVYGFVRFNNQNDQREALIHMNGFAGLNENKRPIKVSIAVPKPGLR